jgi:hypothetical protein
MLCCSGSYQSFSFRTAQPKNITFIPNSHFIKYSLAAWSETISDKIIISTLLRNTPGTSHTILQFHDLTTAVNSLFHRFGFNPIHNLLR